MANEFKLVTSNALGRIKKIIKCFLCNMGFHIF